MAFCTGGNLGLCTGMSILSFFEIAFWIVRFICGIFSSRNSSVKTQLDEENNVQDQTKDAKKNQLILVKSPNASKMTDVEISSTCEIYLENILENAC